MFSMRRRSFINMLPLFAGLLAITYLWVHWFFKMMPLEEVLANLSRGSRSVIVCGSLSAGREVAPVSYDHAFISLLTDNSAKISVYTRAPLKGAGKSEELVCIIGEVVSPFAKGELTAEVALMEESRRTGWRARLFNWVAHRQQKR
jgi:hypothetical protein